MKDHTSRFAQDALALFSLVMLAVRAKQMFEALSESDGTWQWTLPDHFPSGKMLRVVVDGGTLSQDGETLTWDAHGYYEVNLDAESLSWRPD